MKNPEFPPGALRVVGLSGSPRRGGNSETLLDRFLEGAAFSGAACRKIVLDEISLSPCRACAEVNRDGTCRIEDDFQAVYRALREADLAVLAAPVFFGSLPAQVKALVDRFQCHWLAVSVFHTIEQGGENRRRAVFLSTQATGRRDFFRNSRAVAANFFATAGFGSLEELACYGLEGSRDIARKPGCLEKAFALGRDLVSGLKSGCS